MSSITSGTVPRTAASRAVMSRMAGIVFDPKEKRISAGAAASGLFGGLKGQDRCRRAGAFWHCPPPARRTTTSIAALRGECQGAGQSGRQRATAPRRHRPSRQGSKRDARWHPCATAAEAGQPQGSSGGTRARRPERGGPARGVAAPVGGDVPTGAVTKCNSVAQAQGPEKPGGVISMLGRAPAWPIVRTAAQGPAAVVGDHSEARETLGDGTPPLGVLGTGVDQQHRRAGTANLGVQGCSVDRDPNDARRIGAG